MSLARDVLLSLPPVEKMELGSIQAAVKTLPGYQESDWMAWKEFQCHAEIVTTKKNASGALADALVTELQKYQDKRYNNNGSKATVARHSVTTSSTDDSSLCIRTYAELLEPHKFMAGYWASEWSYKSTKLTGTITMQAQYYEDHSNVQFRARRQAPAFSSGSDDDAAALVQHIIRSLDQLHTDLLQLADDQLQTSLKKVRRILPITKTRMKWDDAAQEQVRLLNQEKGTEKKKKAVKK